MGVVHLMIIHISVQLGPLEVEKKIANENVEVMAIFRTSQCQDYVEVLKCYE